MYKSLDRMAAERIDEIRDDASRFLAALDRTEERTST
jgi:hypothetical protein